MKDLQFKDISSFEDIFSYPNDSINIVISDTYELYPIASNCFFSDILDSYKPRFRPHLEKMVGHEVNDETELRRVALIITGRGRTDDYLATGFGRFIPKEGEFSFLSITSTMNHIPVETILNWKHGTIKQLTFDAMVVKNGSPGSVTKENEHERMRRVSLTVSVKF